MSSSHNENVVPLICKIEVQKKIIDQLSLEKRTMEVNFEVRSKMKDLELASLREKCEQFQRWVQVLEDNPPNDDQLKFKRFQNALDALTEENESLRRKNDKMSNEMKDLKSRLSGVFEQCPVEPFDCENERPKVTGESDDSAKGQDEQFTDSRVQVTLAERNQEPTMAAVVESEVQRAIEANIEVQRTSNERTEILDGHIGCESTVVVGVTEVAVESTSPDASKGDVTCTEENCCQVTAELTGHCELKDVQDLIGTAKSTVNDKKRQRKENELDLQLKINPIGALQELCANRQWTLPKYEFFEGGKSGTGFLVECTVRTYKIKVEGLDIKSAKRQAATIMYHKVRKAASKVPLETSLETNVPENKPKGGNGILGNPCGVTSARFDDVSAIAAVVDSVDQRATEVNKVEKTYWNSEPTKNVEDYLSYVSTTRPEENCCKVATELTGRDEIKAVHDHERIQTVKTTVNDQKTQRTDNELDAQLLKMNPIGVLQESCASRRWTLPRYKFSEVGKGGNSFLAECTVLPCTIKAAGRDKKSAKREAATVMYHEGKRITCSGDEVPSGNGSERNVPDSGLVDNGMVGDACVFTSAGCRTKPGTVDAPPASVSEDSRDNTPAEVDKASMFVMSKDVVDHRPTSVAQRDTDRPPVTTEIPESNVNPSANDESVVVNEDEQPLLSSTENADLAKRLRLSSNPGVRELKETSLNAVLSSTELLERIANEEGLTVAYDITETCTLTIRKDFAAIQLTICPRALSVVGFGETLIEAQEDAAHECLTRFGSMLNE